MRLNYNRLSAAILATLLDQPVLESFKHSKYAHQEIFVYPGGTRVSYCKVFYHDGTDDSFVTILAKE